MVFGDNLDIIAQMYKTTVQNRFSYNIYFSPFLQVDQGSTLTTLYPKSSCEADYTEKQWLAHGHPVNFTAKERSEDLKKSLNHARLTKLGKEDCG